LKISRVRQLGSGGNGHAADLTNFSAPYAVKKFDWVLLCFEAKYLFAGN